MYSSSYWLPLLPTSVIGLSWRGNGALSFNFNAIGCFPLRNWYLA